MSLLHAVQLIKCSSSSAQVFTVLKEGKRFPFVKPSILSCLINPAGATVFLFQLIKTDLPFNVSEDPFYQHHSIILFYHFVDVITSPKLEMMKANGFVYLSLCFAIQCNTAVHRMANEQND